MTTPISIAVTLPVTASDAKAWDDASKKPFAPYEVRYFATRWAVTVEAFAQTRTRIALDVQDQPWCPPAPAWFEQAARDMQADAQHDHDLRLEKQIDLAEQFDSNWSREP